MYGGSPPLDPAVRRFRRLALAGILALVGKAALKNFKGKPELAIASIKETVETVKASTSGEVTARVRADDPTESGATALVGGRRTSIG